MRSTMACVIALGVGAGSPLFGAADRHSIELLGFRFDPILDGEPVVRADLRAREDGAYARLQLAASPRHDHRACC